VLDAILEANYSNSQRLSFSTDSLLNEIRWASDLPGRSGGPPVLGANDTQRSSRILTLLRKLPSWGLA